MRCPEEDPPPAQRRPSLLASRRLAPLLVAQTLGALNDNLFKNALVTLILFQAARSGGAALVSLAGGVFILPYVLLSATAGRVADRFEKSRAIVALKLCELGLMVLAAIVFLLGDTTLLFGVLFGLGVQATFLGPLKNAILPVHLAAPELVAGNGLMEAGTFLGILAGTIAGSALLVLDHGRLIVSAVGIAVAVAGLVSAVRIPVAPASAPGLRIGWNLAGETWALLAEARAIRPVWLAILGQSWFWAVGAVLLAELPTLVHVELDATVPVFTLLLTAFSVGIAIGSVLCGRLLRGEVSGRLVPVAALGLSLFIWDFARTAAAAHHCSSVPALLHDPRGWRILFDLLLLSVCGGVYSVSLAAILQERSAASHRARMIAAGNVVNAAAMAVSALATAALAQRGVRSPAILVLTALANLAVAAWLFRVWRGRAAPV